MVDQVGHGNDVTDTYDKDPNDIGRPYRISSSNAHSNWDSGRFEYDGAGNIEALRGMAEPVARPAPTGQLYTYDAFGDLTQITRDGSAQTIGIDSSTNRLSLPATYDAAGNLTHWTDYSYGYDPLNAMATLSGGTLNKAYTYDADGERLSFREGASGPTTYALRGLDGKVLREYTLSGTTWSWGKDVVYRNGQLLASIGSAETRHFTLNHLGSPRLITDSGRNVVEYHAYWGYGQEIDTACGVERMKFTGHERDNQCSAGMLDYMHARYESPAIGRFLGVDRGNAKPNQPQSWNRYAYALGNPILLVDPDGKEPRAALLVTGPTPGQVLSHPSVTMLAELATLHSAIRIYDLEARPPVDLVYSWGGQASGVRSLAGYLAAYDAKLDPTGSFDLKLGEKDVRALQASLGSQRNNRTGDWANFTYNWLTNNCAQKAQADILQATDLSLKQQLGAVASRVVVPVTINTNQLVTRLFFLDLLGTFKWIANPDPPKPAQ